MRRLSPGFFLALAVCAPATFAQTAPLELTLQEAIRRGAADPPSVRVAMARSEATSAQIDSARAGYYPTVTVNGSGSAVFNDSPLLFIDPRTNAAVQQRIQSTALGLNVGGTARIPIYDFGRTGNSVDAATHGSRAAREDLRAARIQAESAVATAYLTVLSDQEAIGAARATVTQREARLQIADGLVTAGARAPIERTRAQVDLDVGRLDLTSAEARERNDRTTLSAALGIDPLRDVTLAAVDDELLRADDDPARAAAAAVASRPEFAASRARLAQAESQSAAARSGRYPSLAAQVSASANYAEILQGRGTSGISEQVQGGLTLSWPAFDPTVRANIRIAEANASAAREALAQQSLQVRAAAVQAAINLRSARLTLDQSERLAANAAANLEQASGRYQSGAAAQLEVVDAQAADASARYAVVRARLAYQVSRVNVLTATGEIDRLAR